MHHPNPPNLEERARLIHQQGMAYGNIDTVFGAGVWFVHRWCTSGLATTHSIVIKGNKCTLSRGKRGWGRGAQRTTSEFANQQTSKEERASWPATEEAFKDSHSARIQLDVFEECSDGFGRLLKHSQLWSASGDGIVCQENICRGNLSGVSGMQRQNHWCILGAGVLCCCSNTPQLQIQLTGQPDTFWGHAELLQQCRWPASPNTQTQGQVQS